MGDRLVDRTVLVTGAASGIGAACVARFVEEGAVVAGLDVQLQPDGSPASPWWLADVQDEARVEQVVADAVERLGHLDVLVNAAGVLSIGSADTMEHEEWDRVLGINLTGTWLVSKHVVRHMVGRGSGSIVNLASVEGLLGFSGQTAYNVSKGGVLLLTRNMAADFGPAGVRVNCLCPGLIDTPLTAVLRDPAFAKIRDRFIDWHLLGRAGRPDEVAAAALFLASDDASFVHGAALTVDGGLTAGRRFLAIGRGAVTPLTVDAHVHVVADDEAAYPLDPSGATGPWYREDPCSVERLVGLLDDADVGAAVLIQAISAYRFDNRYALDAAARVPGRCTAVACLDLAGSDPAGEAIRLLGAGARGLRWVAIHDGGLEEPRAVWTVVADQRVPVVVTLLAEHLPALAAALPHLPSVPLALDHCGFADFRSGIPHDLDALATSPNLHLKVSTIALDLAAEHGDVRDLVGELAARFGARRLMWGSDYSQTHDRPYRELVEYARHAASRLRDDDRDWFLGGTARAVWPELA